tara:strand:+ start:335 stop:673 length:339 start_codon:yes stop_codon:yes gene_type:complete
MFNAKKMKADSDDFKKRSHLPDEDVQVQNKVLTYSQLKKLYEGSWRTFVKSRYRFTGIPSSEQMEIINQMKQLRRKLFHLDLINFLEEQDITYRGTDWGDINRDIYLMFELI